MRFDNTISEVAKHIEGIGSDVSIVLENQDGFVFLCFRHEGLGLQGWRRLAHTTRADGAAAPWCLARAIAGRRSAVVTVTVRFAFIFATLTCFNAY